MVAQQSAFNEWMSNWTLLLDYLTDHIGWLMTFSLSTVIITLALVPVLITRIPADYFTRDKRLHSNHAKPLFSFVFIAAKNLLGAVLLLIGFLLLFLPGQGLIMIFVGLLIMNYPGKYTLERWLIRRPGVLRAMNALRRKHGKLPLLSPVEH